MAQAYCPNCDGVVTAEQPRVGEMATCKGCGIKLEIISTSPFEVDFPLDYQDDWDDDDDDDDNDDDDEEM